MNWRSLLTVCRRVVICTGRFRCSTAGQTDAENAIFASPDPILAIAFAGAAVALALAECDREKPQEIPLSRYEIIDDQVYDKEFHLTWSPPARNAL